MMVDILKSKDRKNNLSYTQMGWTFEKYFMFSDEIWLLLHDFALFTSWVFIKTENRTPV